MGFSRREGETDLVLEEKKTCAFCGRGARTQHPLNEAVQDFPREYPERLVDGMN